MSWLICFFVGHHWAQYRDNRYNLLGQRTRTKTFEQCDRCDAVRKPARLP